jgi:ATP-dependent Clp protease ATP-binding subunit ClpX
VNFIKQSPRGPACALSATHETTQQIMHTPNDIHHRGNDRSKAPAGCGIADSKLLPTPSQLVALLDQKVIGQTTAKRTLAVAAYHHFLACAQSELTGRLVEPTALLLIGPTGCGKSHLLRTLRCLGVPMIQVNCTSLTANGYKGTNVNEVLERLESELLEDGRTQPAIIHWEEFDKIRQLPAHHPFNSRGVQEDLLTFLEGTLCGRTGQLDSSRFMNVASGAFVELEKVRKPQIIQSGIGFHATFDQADPATTPGPLTTEHLTDYGLIPELIGRFGSITELDPPDATTLRHILTHAGDNPIVNKRQLYELHGIALDFSDEAIDEMVARAIGMGTGARSLKRILEDTLHGIDHRLPDLAADGITGIVVSAETVRGGEADMNRNSTESKPLNRLLFLRERAGGYRNWQKKSKEEQSIW